LRDDPRAIVFFEAPHRIGRTLTDLETRVVDRPIYINSEITKIHEKLVIRYNCLDNGEDLANAVGEYTVIIGPPKAEGDEASQAKCLDVFGRLTEIGGFSDEEAETMTAASLGTTMATVRKIVKKARISAKQRDQSVP
jgi:16S rRNA (cytidine1402-2'-O)-methyltransferase